MLRASFQGLPVDHIAIAVRDLDRASQPYVLLGLRPLEPDEKVASQQVRVRVLQAGASLVELLEPTAETSPIARFLEKRGEGLHHIAFRVEDLEAEIRRLETEGAVFIDSTPRGGRAGTRVVFLHPKWAGGVLVELVAHA